MSGVLRAVDPSNGEVVREVAAATEAETEQILAEAERAFEPWRRASFDERAKVLRRVAEKMRSDVDRLAMFMTEEMGKPIREARGEVQKAAWCAEHYADHAESYLRTEYIDSDATRSYVQYLPLGPVLGILPWNAPFWLAFRYCAPALMAGNTCVMKHDSHVPGSAQAIAKVFEEADAPAGIFANLPLETPAVEAVIRDRRITGISFTGSTRGGAAVASIAASEIKRTVLELGGSDPAIVLEDADLEAAADALAKSRIINAGQSCIAPKRILAVGAVHDRLVELLHDRLARLVLGDPRDERTDVGPIARAELRDELHRQVQGTVDRGATARLGGEIPDGPGFYYPVTLLTGVSTDMPAACEETFGPVATVMKVDDLEHAMRVANDTPYGLASSVWTTAERGEALARDIAAGQVVVNGLVKTDPRLPSGGIKRSGYGRELGPHGIREFANAQQVWVGPAKA